MKNSLTTEELVTAWSQTGLLNGLSAEQGNNCVLALEAQRIANEQVEGQQWRRVSIPVVRRLYGVIENLKGTMTPKKEVRSGIYVKDHFPTGGIPSENVKTYLDDESNGTATATWVLSKYIVQALENNEFEALSSITIDAGEFVLHVS